MSIGTNIKECRNQRGLTQLQLAARVKISRSYLAGVEGDRYNPSVDTLQKIAAALGTTTGVLLGEASFAELVAANTGNKAVMDWFEQTRSGENKPTIPEDDGLTENQRLLMQYARMVPPDKVDIVLRVMKSIVEAD